MPPAEFCTSLIAPPKPPLVFIVFPNKSCVNVANALVAVFKNDAKEFNAGMIAFKTGRNAFPMFNALFFSNATKYARLVAGPCMSVLPYFLDACSKIAIIRIACCVLKSNCAQERPLANCWNASVASNIATFTLIPKSSIASVLPNIPLRIRFITSSIVRPVALAIIEDVSSILTV